MRLIYTPHRDWQGTLNLKELKNAFKVRGLKFKCEKYYKAYGFIFDEKYNEQVERAYKVLINICDLEIG